MKKLHYILFLPILAMVSCSNGQSTESSASAPSEMLADAGVESPSEGPVHLGKTDFLAKVHNFEANPDWKFEGSRPAIVDFYADWCKPCKMVAPYLEELSTKYQGQIDIYKVNVDEQQDIAAFYRISSIPTFFFIDSQGRVMGSMGYNEKSFFEEQIQNMLGANNPAASATN